MRKYIKASNNLLLDDKYDEIRAIAYDMAIIADSHSVDDFRAANQSQRPERTINSANKRIADGSSFNDVKIEELEDLLYVLTNAINSAKAVSDSSSNLVSTFEHAADLLDEAGYVMLQDNVTADTSNGPLEIEVLKESFGELVNIVKLFIKNGAKNTSGQGLGGSWTAYSLTWNHVAVEVKYTGDITSSILITFTLMRY